MPGWARKAVADRSTAVAALFRGHEGVWGNGGFDRVTGFFCVTCAVGPQKFKGEALDRRWGAALCFPPHRGENAPMGRRTGNRSQGPKVSCRHVGSQVG